MKCNNCGQALTNNEKFCPKCGEKATVDKPKKSKAGCIFGIIFSIIAILLIIVVIITILFAILWPNIKNRINENTNNINKPTYVTPQATKTKANVYIFTREGCGHCAKAKAFFENIKDEYDFNLYNYEIWYNPENAAYLESVAEYFGDSEGTYGVPYIVIGNRRFVGINEEIQEEIINQIKKESKNDNANDVVSTIIN